MSKKELLLGTPLSFRFDPVTTAYQLANSIAPQSADTVLSTGSSITISYQPVTGSRHALGSIFWSLSASPTNVRLTVESGSGIVIFQTIPTAAGPGYVPFSPYQLGAESKELIVKLTPVATGTYATLTVTHWVE